MILTHRLVRLIETRSNDLADTLMLRVHQSPALRSYSNVPPEELKQRVREIYQHLGEWLIRKTEADIERRYVKIGARRFQQKVALNELIWAIIQTKENLWDFLNRESCPGFEVEILAEHEVFRMLDRFFNHAIHYAATGYEEAALAEKGAESQVTV
jgi:hypothetical protein